MLGGAQHFSSWPGLYDLAGIHHEHSGTKTAHEGDVVCDQQESHAVLAVQLSKQRHDLGLDCHVECGRGFVGDEQRRVVCQPHCSHYPLPHPAAELVRVAARTPFRLRHLDLSQKLKCPLLSSAAIIATVSQHRFLDLSPNP
jgi:hypothetical protein